MTFHNDKDRPLSVTRRAFIGASTAAAAALVAGCSPEQKLGETSEGATGAGLWRVDADVDDQVEGTWIPVPCWTSSCGGKCLLKAYVVDGVVTRIKTDDLVEETDELEVFQNRACPRGRAQRMHVYDAARLKYPMKRKNWQPGGGEKSNGHLRGIDEWERVSWDEALDLLAEETKRVYDTYGARSVLLPSFGRTAWKAKFLNPMGGYTNFAMTDSHGSFNVMSGPIGVKWGGNFEPGCNSMNDRLDMRKSDVIVIHGGNSVWASAGAPAYHLWKCKEAGAEFIYIGPEYNVTASLVEAKWLPVRPGTDTAFMLAVVYEMLKLDEDKGDIIDWDFLDNYTVGFDDDHMPADAKLTENVSGYVRGEYDGIPKTAEWASEICGTPADDIRWYAEKVGKSQAVSMFWSYAPCRTNASESLPQLMETVACMGGHHGKPGHACGPVYHAFAANSGDPNAKYGVLSEPETIPGKGNEVDDMIFSAFLWQAINEGRYPFFGDVTEPINGMPVWKQPEERDIDIRMIWCAWSNPLSTRVDFNAGVEAWRKVDCVVSIDHHFTATCQYADLVLPCTTQWEGPGYDETQAKPLYNYYNRDTLFVPAQYAIAPMYEAMSERDMIRGMLERCGFDPDDVYPYDEGQKWFDRINNATVLDDDGETWMPLATVTQETLDVYGVKGTVQEGKIAFEQLVEDGVYHVPRKEGDKLGWIAYQDFIEDPEANPLPTTSGKWELYCQQKADTLNMFGWADEPIKPYPEYRVPLNGYEESFSDWESKTKGAYPLQLINGHYLRRGHTANDTVGWLREAFVNPVFMNDQDASERGIATGDWVVVTSPHGKVVRQASVLSTIMPGVVNLPHGGWQEKNEELGLDFGGGENSLTGNEVQNSPVSGFNTTLVQIEKYENQNLEPDAVRAPIAPAGIQE